MTTIENAYWVGVVLGTCLGVILTAFVATVAQAIRRHGGKGGK